MGGAGWKVRADFSEGDFLSLIDRVVKAPHGFAGASAHDGAGDVAEVAGLLRSAEKYHDDRLVRAQRPVARSCGSHACRPPATMVLAASPHA